MGDFDTILYKIITVKQTIMLQQLLACLLKKLMPIIVQCTIIGKNRLLLSVIINHSQTTFCVTCHYQ